MDLAFLTVIRIVGVALLFDDANGFHDSANSIFTLEPQTATDHSRGPSRP